MASTGTDGSRWSLRYTGNRVMWAVIAAFVIWFVAQGTLLPLVVGAVTYLVLTAVSTRRQAGTDRQP